MKNKIAAIFVLLFFISFIYILISVYIRDKHTLKYGKVCFASVIKTSIIKTSSKKVWYSYQYNRKDYSCSDLVSLGRLNFVGKDSILIIVDSTNPKNSLILDKFNYK